MGCLAWLLHGDFLQSEGRKKTLLHDCFSDLDCLFGAWGDENNGPEGVLKKGECYRIEETPDCIGKEDWYEVPGHEVVCSSNKNVSLPAK